MHVKPVFGIGISPVVVAHRVKMHHFIPLIFRCWAMQSHSFTLASKSIPFRIHCPPPITLSEGNADSSLDENKKHYMKWVLRNNPCLLGSPIDHKSTLLGCIDRISHPNSCPASLRLQASVPDGLEEGHGLSAPCRAPRIEASQDEKPCGHRDPFRQGECGSLRERLRHLRLEVLFWFGPGAWKTLKENNKSLGSGCWPCAKCCPRTKCSPARSTCRRTS